MLWGKHEHIKLNIINAILILSKLHHNFNQYFQIKIKMNNKQEIFKLSFNLINLQTLQIPLHINKVRVNGGQQETKKSIKLDLQI